jgi:hypothetical protein
MIVDLSYIIKYKIVTPLTYLLFSMIFVYLITGIYIKIAQFKTSYLIVPYERLFILILLLLVGAHMYGIFLIDRNHKKKSENTSDVERGLDIIIISLSIFLILTWVILILPVSSSLWEGTDHDQYLLLLEPKKQRK